MDKPQVTQSRTEHHNIHNPSFHWTEIEETFTIKDIIYTRSWDTDWSDGRESDKPGHFTARDGSDDKPGVICGTCFGIEFILSYGSYVLFAKCVKCEHCDVVYDG